MISKYGTDTRTLVYSAGSEATDSTEWQDISPDVIWVTVIEHKEPAQEQDESDTGGRAPVTWKRPHRRLATVNRAVRNRRPRQAASTYG